MRHGRATSAFALADPALREVSVAYSDVPLPTSAELHSLLADVPRLSRSLVGIENGPQVDVTSLVDMSMRFACLAYRRNAQSQRHVLVLRDDETLEPYGVEIQFRTPLGAHAVVYLMQRGGLPLNAVVTFKGSTLSSPGAPLLSDWVANLQVLLPWRVRRGAEMATGSASDGKGGQDAALLEGHRARVHPGWHAYLGELLASFRRFDLSELPVDLKWGDLLRGGVGASGALGGGDLWQLLCSPRCRVLMVGHSLGGALAAMAATMLGHARIGSRASTAGEDSTDDSLSASEGEEAPEGEATPSSRSPAAASAGSPATKSAATTGAGTGASSAPPRARSWRSWRASAGREGGGEGYRFGDLTRSIFTRLTEASGGGDGGGGGGGGGASPDRRARESDAQRAGAPEAARTRRARAVRAQASEQSEGLPMLVTFGSPVTGGRRFVSMQRRYVAMGGGLRVYNELDPVPSTGYGVVSSETATAGSSSAAHAGVAVSARPLGPPRARLTSRLLLVLILLLRAPPRAQVVLRNDALTAVNPYTNHLRYTINSYELCRTLCRDLPALRVRYMLPGINYAPDANNSHIAPPATLAGLADASQGGARHLKLE